MVAGGVDSDSTYYDTSEIFNFGTMSWREGPRLPQAFARAEAVQVKNACPTQMLVSQLFEGHFISEVQDLPRRWRGVRRRELGLPRHRLRVRQRQLRVDPKESTFMEP